MEQRRSPLQLGKTGSKRRPGRGRDEGGRLELPASACSPGPLHPSGGPHQWERSGSLALSMTLTWGRHRETARGVTCGAKAQGEQQNHGAVRQRGQPHSRSRSPGAAPTNAATQRPHHALSRCPGGQRSESEVSEGELSPPLPWLAGALLAASGTPWFAGSPAGTASHPRVLSLSASVSRSLRIIRIPVIFDQGPPERSPFNLITPVRNPSPQKVTV